MRLNPKSSLQQYYSCVIRLSDFRSNLEKLWGSHSHHLHPSRSSAYWKSATPFKSLELFMSTYF